MARSVDRSFTLGLPSFLSRETAARSYLQVRSFFEYLYGPSSESLPSDLTKTSRFFDPVAQGQRLRKELAGLQPYDGPFDAIPEAWILDAGEGRRLLTPEGVSGLHVLKGALSSPEPDLLFLDSEIGAAHLALLAQYQLWSRKRLDGVLALMSGEDSPLQHKAIGALIALLVNNNIGPDSGLARVGSASESKRRVIDEAFFGAVTAFTLVLAPGSGTKSGGDRLISGWYLGEISRRLPGGLIMTKPLETAEGRVYLDARSVDAALNLIVSDLTRGNRAVPTPEIFAQAFDALVEQFLESRVALATYGELRELPRLTAQLRERLVGAYREAWRSRT